MHNLQQKSFFFYKASKVPCVIFEAHLRNHGFQKNESVVQNNSVFKEVVKLLIRAANLYRKVANSMLELDITSRIGESDINFPTGFLYRLVKRHMCIFQKKYEKKLRSVANI